MIERIVRFKLRILVSLGIMLCLVSAVPPTLSTIPFWRTSEGCWLSENSYLNTAMEPNIPTYASLTCIEIDGHQVIERETKFYPESDLASIYGGALLLSGEGVEVVTKTVAITEGSSGAVRLISSSPAFSLSDQVAITAPLTDDTAMVKIRIPGDPVDLYRMFITMPTPDLRYVLNLGIAGSPTQAHGAGELRGLSVFRQRRVSPSESVMWRDRLRKRFFVSVRVTAGSEGSPISERMGKPCGADSANAPH